MPPTIPPAMAGTLVCEDGAGVGKDEVVILAAAAVAEEEIEEDVLVAAAASEDPDGRKSTATFEEAGGEIACRAAAGAWIGFAAAQEGWIGGRAGVPFTACWTLLILEFAVEGCIEARWSQCAVWAAIGVLTASYEVCAGCAGKPRAATGTRWTECLSSKERVGE